mmetsp:Transcript_32386/g.96699  ORF Transcript_32386/g.96699 Transcript_32386/m.96699 type:complete len:437 (+) Transcript_32386:378-1688(+)
MAGDVANVEASVLASVRSSPGWSVLCSLPCAGEASVGACTGCRAALATPVSDRRAAAAAARTAAAPKTDCRTNGAAVVDASASISNSCSEGAAALDASAAGSNSRATAATGSVPSPGCIPGGRSGCRTADTSLAVLCRAATPSTSPPNALVAVASASEFACPSRSCSSGLVACSFPDVLTSAGVAAIKSVDAAPASAEALSADCEPGGCDVRCAAAPSSVWLRGVWAMPPASAAGVAAVRMSPAAGGQSDRSSDLELASASSSSSSCGSGTTAALRSGTAMAASAAASSAVYVLSKLPGSTLPMRVLQMGQPKRRAISPLAHSTHSAACRHGCSRHPRSLSMHTMQTLAPRRVVVCGVSRPANGSSSAPTCDAELLGIDTVPYGKSIVRRARTSMHTPSAPPPPFCPPPSAARALRISSLSARSCPESGSICMARA